MHKLMILLLSGLSLNAIAADTEMTVYRSPTCGCCGKWIEHVKQNGFKVKDIVSDDMQAIKEKQGLPDKLASCHTAIVDGYVVEGHVPAGDIQKMLDSKPDYQIWRKTNVDPVHLERTVAVRKRAIELKNSLNK